MLIKKLMNWKELSEEEKTVTKRELKDVGLIFLGGASALMGMRLGNKIFDKRYPMRSFRTEWAEGSDEFIIRLCATSKSGKKKIPVEGIKLSLAQATSAIEAMREEVATASAALGQAEFNSAIEAATENL